MMNYFDFNEDDRKKLFKLVTEKEYKKTPRRFHPPKTAITKIFKTTDMSRVDFKDLKKYVEQNYFAYNDNFVIFYGGMLDRKLEELFYFHGEFKVLLKDTEYKDLNEEQKDLIEKHREEYNQEGISLDYDKYILFMCKPNELSFERIRSEKAIEYLDTIKKEKEALEEKYNNEILKNNEYKCQHMNVQI